MYGYYLRKLPPVSVLSQALGRRAAERTVLTIESLQWAHIGRVVFAGSNDQLYELTGPGNRENFTMDWHTRDVLQGCPQKDIEVIGPLEAEGRIVVEESDKYWITTRN